METWYRLIAELGLLAERVDVLDGSKTQRQKVREGHDHLSDRAEL